ncbi:HotDog domain-containing protein [Nemania sp. NC0429]|nr:HotDog domain-containing protein [Nemania sp. NC0429]
MSIAAMNSLDHSHFAAISWCAPHLQGDRIVTGTPRSRVIKTTGEDALFGHTLNSESTIVRMLQVHEEPASATERVNEIKVFLTLGSGLNGYPDICHGGLVTTIMDEVIGILIPVNRERKNISSGTHMTAYLNTSFIRPVPTPATILARAWFTKIEGRKFYTQGSIEDESGRILARADALFVELKTSL